MAPTELDTKNSNETRDTRNSISTMAVSGDGRTMVEVAALKTKDGVPLVVWDVVAGTKRSTKDFDSTVKAIAISADGALIATGHENGTIIVWDVATLSKRATLAGHTTAITSLAFSPDGKQLASGANKSDGAIRLWDVATGKELSAFTGFNGGGYVAFGPDPQIFLAASGAKVSRKGNATFVKLSETTGAISALAVDPQGRTVAVARKSSEHVVEICDATTGAVTLTISTSAPVSLAYHPDGRSLAIGTTIGVVRLVDVATGEDLKQFKLGPENGRINAVAFDRTGRYLLTANGNQTFYVLRLAK